MQLAALVTACWDKGQQGSSLHGAWGPSVLWRLAPTRLRVHVVSIHADYAATDSQQHAPPRIARAASACIAAA